MKSFLRTMVFTTITISLVNYLLNSLNFGTRDSKSLFMLILTLTLFNLFIRQILALVSLPRDGTGYLFINILLTIVIMFLLTVIIPDFSIKTALLPELNIFGFVLPSKQLDGLWAMAITGTVLSLIYNFFEWLCSRK